MENDADNHVHNDPIILYKLLRGTADYFRELEKSAPLNSLNEFFDEHAPTNQRIQVAENRMQALYDRYESVRTFVDNEKG